MKNHSIIELSCEYKMQTDKGLCVVNLKNEDVWLPKSQIEIDHMNEKDMIVDIQCPEWLAVDKGLL